MSGLIDISFVRFRAPDTQRALSFLNDFGLTESARSNGSVYLRCAGPAHHVYILEQGDPEFVGFGFEAESEDSLRELAGTTGVEVRESAEPGGGAVVTLTDPDGYRVDVVHGVERVEPGLMRAPLVLNYANEKQRINETQRPEVGPAEIKRLGHLGIKVSSLPQSISWYAATLGMKTTDVLTAGPEEHEVAAFLRLDRGDEPVDHHTIVVFESPKPQFHHCAFETQDYDAVGTSHEWLRAQGWDHSFGVGRHLLGSQVFDYWFDPWGRKHEHFADGDLFTQSRQIERHPIDRSPIALWGGDPPPNFLE
jgi:catechol 2,3-dioxygenase-like lactoylglutathione lyase family enzyme